MAVRFNNDANNRLARTSGTVIDADAPYSWSLWVRFATLTASEQTIFVIRDDSDITNSCDIVYAKTGAFAMQVEHDGTQQIQAGGTPATNTWYWIGARRVSTTSHVTVIKDAAGATLTTLTNTYDVSVRGSWARMHLGVLLFAGGYYWPADSRIAALKVWDRDIGADQLAGEQWTIAPLASAPWGWYPLMAGASERIRDYSPNARPFVNEGTITDEDGPPILWDLPSAYGLPQSAAAVPASLLIPPRRMPLAILAR